MAIDALIGALIGFGASEVMGGMGNKKAKGPSQATLPSQANANTDASATVADQRAAMLYAGGQTDMTGGLGVLTGSDTSKSTLVGS
jgi:hypothetical protein